MQNVYQKHTSPLFLHPEHFSSMFTGSFYILDIQLRQFYYVKPDDLFLCGFSAEDVFRMGYEFYSKIIHPEDLRLCMDMHQTVIQHLKDSKETQGEIDYFSCTFRLQRNYHFEPSRPLPKMVYQRMIPIWEEGKSWFNIRNQPPCNSCIYQWLCPPPSNYEIAIGRPNLCHVKNNN